MNAQLKIIFLFLAILSIGLPIQGEDLSEEEKEFYEKFREFGTSYSDSRTYQLPQKIREPAKEKADALYKELLRDPKKTGEFLFSVFEKSESLRTKSDLVHFAAAHGLAKEHFLPAMRDIIVKADLNENYTVALGAAVNYIEKNGDGADVELLQRLSAHFNPGIKSGSSYAIRQIKEREKTGSNRPNPDPRPKLDNSTPEPTFATKPRKADKKPAVPEVVEPALDNPFPYWIFIIGGVVVVGLVILLKRK